MPIKAVVRRLGVARNAVLWALAAVAPPKYVRPQKGAGGRCGGAQIRALLAKWPTMPVTVIAGRQQRVAPGVEVALGWDRSLTVLRDRVQQVRPKYVRPDPVDELCRS